MIRIENPCHENWNAMTPTRDGAFCSNCLKNVIDFSAKSIEEIKFFFESTPSDEPVCGRFQKQQLETLSFDEFFNRFKTWRWLHKAAIIFFFVFGTALFGAGSLGAQTQVPRTDTVSHGSTTILSEGRKPGTTMSVSDSILLLQPNRVDDVQFLGYVQRFPTLPQQVPVQPEPKKTKNKPKR